MAGELKKVNILIVDLFWPPLTLFISKTITTKSNHAGHFIKKLHKKTVSKYDFK
jgi:hypothetical protein